MSSPYKFSLPNRNFIFSSKIQKLRVKFCLQFTNFGYPSQILEFRCTRTSVLSWRTLTNTWIFCRRRLILFVQISQCDSELSLILTRTTWLFQPISFLCSFPASIFPVDVFHVASISRVSPPYVETKRNPRTTQQIFLSFGERWMNVFQCSFSGFCVKLRCTISFPDPPLPSQCPD